jgi:hypothetical protein
LQDYLDSVTGILLSASTEAVTVSGPEVIQYEEERARIAVTVGFPGGSRLEMRLRVDMTGGNPEWTYYSFHYMNSGSECIFRYDNARHYAELPYFPNHKHEGQDERVIACRQPSIRRIRDEKEAHLRVGD